MEERAVDPQVRLERSRLAAELWQKRAELRLKQTELKLRQADLALRRRELAAARMKTRRDPWQEVRTGLSAALALVVGLTPPALAMMKFAEERTAAANADLKAVSATANARLEEAVAMRSKARLEARKAFAARQFKLYTDAVDVVGKLTSTEKESAEYREALQRFNRLYWSELPLVEDGKVASAMRYVKDVVEGRSPDEPRISTDEETAAHSLSEAVRESLDHSFSY